MNKTNKTLIIVLILGMTLSMGCVDTYIGQTVEVGFRDGSYQTYSGIERYVLINDGIFSNTYDFHKVTGAVFTLHYVTSIRVVN